MEGKLRKDNRNPNSWIFNWIEFDLCENRNLVDAANIAALAALSTFRRPECTFGGEDGQQLIIHPPDVIMK